jgi:hypothetical protein
MKQLLSSRFVITVGMITALAVTSGFFHVVPMWLKWD